MATIDLKLLPKQKLFVLNGAKQCLYSGAFGAGKSYSLCVKLLVRASKKRAREALVRKTLSDLKGTTMRTLLIGDGDTPPVLPPGSYEHVKSERLIKLRGGGEIVYFSMEDSSTIGSYNLSGAAVDQAEELTDDDWHFLLGRLRSTGEGITRQLYAVCNPDSPSHHLAQRFGLAPDALIPQPGCWVVTTSSADNPHLPADYIEVLNSFTGVRKKRYVQGIWAGADGVVYDTWDRAVHLKDRITTPDEIAKVLIAVDDGTTVPFAALRILCLRSGHKHVERMVYRRNMLMQDKVEAIESLGGKTADAVIVDPAASALKLHLRSEGFIVRDADNEVLAGVQEVQTQLSTSPDGSPWMTVSTSCVDLVREIETYEWKTKKGVQSGEQLKDEVVKENDHAVDALRYACMADRLPVSVAVDRKAVVKLGKNMIEDRKPLHVGVIEPVMGWSIEAEDACRKGKKKIMTLRSGDGEMEWKLWCDLPDDAPNPEDRFALAASVGSGAPGSMSVLKIGNSETRRVVGELVCIGAAPGSVARAAIAAGIWFNNAKLIWNHVGGGVAFGEVVRQLHYRNIYRHVVEGVAGEEPGWRYTPAGILSLLGNLQDQAMEGKYHEATPETISDLQRWAYNADGSVSPVSGTSEGEIAKHASDRALAAMLLSHVFRWIERKEPKPKIITPGSVEWLERREASSKGMWSPERARR